MIRRLTVALPVGDPDGAGPGALVPPHPMRILAVSDETDPTLSEHLDRTALGPLDLLVSCGDLPPDYLSYLDGVLRVPFVFVRGNHDLDDVWEHEAGTLLPEPRRSDLVEIDGFDVVALDWPGRYRERTRSQDLGVWRHVIALRLSAALRGRQPLIVVSHVSPHDADDVRDVYHRAFGGYHWLAEQLRPALWLHGHTTPASVPERVTHIGPTTCVNVTGAYLIELAPAHRPSEVVSRGAGRSAAPPADPRPAARSAPPRG